MKETRKYKFSWDLLGNIKEGRPNLGNTTRVEVYRLFQFAFRDVIEQHVDMEKGELTLTVFEDLYCSGLPDLDYEICRYDEGFIASLLECFLVTSLLSKRLIAGVLVTVHAVSVARQLCRV
jgi:hypothetical protein